MRSHPVREPPIAQKTNGQLLVRQIQTLCVYLEAKDGCRRLLVGN